MAGPRLEIQVSPGPLEVRLRDPRGGAALGRWFFGAGGRSLTIDLVGEAGCTCLLDGRPADSSQLAAGFIAWARLVFEVNGTAVEMINRDPEALARHYSRPAHQEVAYAAPGDPWVESFHFARVAQLRRLLSGVQGRVLDVGSGYSLVRMAGPWPFQLAACDIDPEAIALLQKEGVEAAWAPADRLPFPDRRFDAVFAGEILEHLPEAEPALREWLRVLRPGGRLVLTTPNRRHLMARVTGHEAVINSEHLREYSVRELRLALAAAGARVVSVQGLTLPVPAWVPGRGWRDLAEAAQVRVRLPQRLLVRWHGLGRRLPALARNLAVVAVRGA